MTTKNEILDAVETKALIINAAGETISRGERIENGAQGWTMSDGNAFRFADVSSIEPSVGFNIVRLTR
jgi:hypothetical protein